MLLAQSTLSPQDQEIAEQLAATFASRVRVVTRGFLAFNYHIDPKDSRASTTATATDMTRIRDAIGRYWRTTTSTNHDGFFLAEDPAISRYYGGSKGNWVLTQIRIRPGLKYLDTADTGPFRFSIAEGLPTTASPADREFSDTANQILQQAGCVGGEDAFLVAQKTDRCKAITDFVLSKLGVNALFYSYTASQYSGCNVNHMGAFILLDDKELKPEDVHIFTPKAHPLGRAELYLEGAYERAIADQARAIKPEAEREYAEYKSSREKQNLPLQANEADFISLAYGRNDINPDGTSKYGPLLPAAANAAKRGKSLDGWLHENLFSCGNFSSTLPAARDAVQPCENLKQATVEPSGKLRELAGELGPIFKKPKEK